MEISQRLFDVFELRDGRVLRIREYLDHDKPSKPPGCGVGLAATAASVSDRSTRMP
jgi:hypothetical protein